MTGRPNDLVAFYLNLPFYKERDWAAQYWREHNLSMNMEYSPYVIWRSTAYEGETINISEDGIRRTPEAQCVPGSLKVYIFGGSTMRGWGAPDWGTIPAYLQRILASHREEHVCVVNYGENAYVSTQSLVQLQLLLGAGNIPDVVIFYDGVNEIYAAEQTKQPAVHQNLAEIKSKLEQSQPNLLSWLRTTHAFTLFYRVSSTMMRVEAASKSEDQPNLGASQLASEIAVNYLNNYTYVGALAGTYGFDYHFFWQPHILIGQKLLTIEEKEMVFDIDWVCPVNDELDALFQATYALIESEAATASHLHYLGDVFDQETAQIWIDSCGHITPDGNRLVAERIWTILGSVPILQ